MSQPSTQTGAPDARPATTPPSVRDDAVVTPVRRLEALAFDLGLGLARLLGVDRASAFGGWAMRALGPLLGGVERRALTNMRAAFPDADDATLKARIKEAWDNLGRTAAEYAHLDAFNPFDDPDRVRLIGAERLMDYAKTGKPVIFVSGHIANWEVIGTTLHGAGLRTAYVYRAANNPLIDRRIIAKRAAHISADLIPKDHRGRRRLMQAAKEGRPLGMLVDQKLREGIEARLFGRPAMTSPTPARFAIKYEADIVPVTVRRTRGARFEIRFDPPLAFEPTGDPQADVLALTQKINDAIEAMIRAEPGQWLWFHRRFPKSEYAA